MFVNMDKLDLYFDTSLHGGFSLFGFFRIYCLDVVSSELSLQ